MAGPWEDYRQGSDGGMPWNDYRKPLGAPQELSALERFAASLPDWMAGSSGGVRGSAIGRLAMGAADPGVALVQLAANAIGHGDAVNKSISDTEAQYQEARKAAGSEGFDPARLVGNIAMTAPVGLAGRAATTLGGMAVKGAAQGAAGGALQPVTGEGSFWQDKALQVGAGAAGGAIAAPAVGAAARLVSPRASVNPDLDLLAREGVRPTIGQTLGGVANTLEQKATSIPLVGDAIRAARRRAVDDYSAATMARTIRPVGGGVSEAGHEGVKQMKAVFDKQYDDVLSRMGMNVRSGLADDGSAIPGSFVDKMSNLRGLVPKHLREQFDDYLQTVIGRAESPNGSLSGRNLQDVWRQVRDDSTAAMRSGNYSDRKFGEALKEVHNLLKEEVTAATTDKAAVAQFNKLQKAYAEYKRIARAAGASGAEDGKFSPAQLRQAVGAMERNKDVVGRGGAPLQAWSEAGKKVIGGSVPDSGTPGRLMAAGLAGGAAYAEPMTLAALGGGAVAYAAPVQNALVALIRKRPESAPEVANAIRRYLAGPAAVAAGDYSSGGVVR